MLQFQELNDEVKRFVMNNTPINFTEYPALEEVLSDFGFLMVAVTAVALLAFIVFFITFIRKPRPLQLPKPQKVELISSISPEEGDRAVELVKKMIGQGKTTEQIVKKLLEVRYGPDIINRIIKKARSGTPEPAPKTISSISPEEEAKAVRLVKKMMSEGMESVQIVNRLEQIKYGPDVINRIIQKAKEQ